MDEDHLLARLMEADGVLCAIEEGELLSEVPASPGARRRHAAGVSLLAILRRNIANLVAEVGSGSEPR